MPAFAGLGPRRPHSLLNKLLNQLLKRKATHSRTNLERSVQIIRQINRSAHKSILMCLCSSVNQNSPKLAWCANLGYAVPRPMYSFSAFLCPLPHVLIQPFQHRLVPELAILGFQDPVTFVGEVQQLGLDAAPLQG